MDDGPGRPYSPSLADRLQHAAVTRPVSARTFAKLGEGTDDAIKLYSNDLFGENGDMHAAPVQEQGIPAYQPSNNLSGSGPSQKLQQQRSMAAQKRLERMQSSGVATNNDAAPRSPSGQSPLNSMHSRLSSADSVSAPVFPRQSSAAGSLVSHPSAAPSWLGPAEGKLQVVELDHGHDPSIEEISNEDAAPLTSEPRKQQSKAPGVGKHARIEIADVKTFLMTPAPSSRPVLCYIVRDKGSAKMYPKYSLFLEDGNRFLLSARKRKKSRSSNYLLSLHKDELARDAPSFFGKVRSNFVGTDFLIFDKGDKQDGSRQEYGVVTYQYNVLGTRGPRKMTAAISMLDEQGKRLYKGGANSMLERVKGGGAGAEQLLVLRNKPPKWNDSLNAYCLNFNGRVTEASVKNFQLISEDNREYVVLQFGKVGKDTFTMDFQWPMTAFQAFSICLSSFDNKLACE